MYSRVSVGFLVSLAWGVIAASQNPKRPVVNISHPPAKLVGTTNATLGYDYWTNIPFAQPPTGKNRLTVPVAITKSLGTVNATGLPRSCPQFAKPVNTEGLPPKSAKYLDFGSTTLPDVTEDCLIINVWRPTGVSKDTKLPVAAWIYGGGFEEGATEIYEPSQLFAAAKQLNKPFMYVSMNYRLAAYGFLQGKEVAEAGIANLGLLDQRLALEWIHDNIAAFGGNASHVTIWGESAGSYSVLDQMLLYDGNNTYKGEPLFHAAIMDSGSLLPAYSVNDSVRGQDVYDAVVNAALCDGYVNTTYCLRSVSYEAFQNASISVPNLFGVDSLALSYLPRPDGKVITASPEKLIAEGKFADVPLISGNRHDEGTVWALDTRNVTTPALVNQYFKNIWFEQESQAKIDAFTKTYPTNPAAGSPFGTGSANELYTGFKRLAAIIGDVTFEIQNRIFFEHAARSKGTSTTKRWAYLATYLDKLPYIGTFHGGDSVTIYTNGIPGNASKTFTEYYVNFFTDMDPNGATQNPGLAAWEPWNVGERWLQIGANVSKMIPGNFRQSSYEQLMKAPLYQ